MQFCSIDLMFHLIMRDIKVFKIFGFIEFKRVDYISWFHGKRRPMFPSFGISGYLGKPTYIGYYIDHIQNINQFKLYQIQSNLLQQRMNQHKYMDADFYQRKIIRLQDQMFILQDELTKVRIRLRIAEDFQIKYNIALENAQTDLLKAKIIFEKQHQNKMKQIISRKLQQNDEKWEKQMRERQQINLAQMKKQLDQTKKSLQLATNKLAQLNQKKQEMEIFSFKIRKCQRQNESLSKQLQQSKKYYEKQKQQELTSLKNHLNTIHRQKLNNERKVSEAKILNLETKLRDLQFQRDRDQFTMPEDSSTENLIKIQSNFEQNKRYNQKQLEMINQQLEMRHSEYLQALKDKQEMRVKFQQQLITKKNFIQGLQDKISKMMTQHTRQLISTVNKAEKIKQKQIQLLKQMVRQLQQKYVSLDEFWKDKYKQHEKQFQQIDIKHKSQLQLYQKEVQQYRSIFNNFQLIKAQKGPQRPQSRYNRQQKKKEDTMFILLSNQLKLYKLKYNEILNNNIKLQKQIINLRGQFKQNKKQLEEYYDNEIKRYVQNISKLQMNVKQYLNKAKGKELELRKYKKQMDDLKDRHNAQKQKYQDINGALERNYKILADKNKRLEDTVQQLRNKTMNSNVDKVNLMIQKWNQIQQEGKKLQNQFKLKQDSLNNLHYLQKSQITKNVAKAKFESEVLSKQNEVLKKQNRRLLGELQYNKENRLSDYNKKIATLNLEISMTQNIFEYLKTGQSKGQQDQQIISNKRERILDD